MGKTITDEEARQRKALAVHLKRHVQTLRDELDALEALQDRLDGGAESCALTTSEVFAIRQSMLGDDSLEAMTLDVQL